MNNKNCKVIQIVTTPEGSSQTPIHTGLSVSKAIRIRDKEQGKVDRQDFDPNRIVSFCVVGTV